MSGTNIDSQLLRNDATFTSIKSFDQITLNLISYYAFFKLMDGNKLELQYLVQFNSNFQVIILHGIILQRTKDVGIKSSNWYYSQNQIQSKREREKKIHFIILRPVLISCSMISSLHVVEGFNCCLAYKTKLMHSIHYL